ncbi:MAG: SDR family NAD(P)-dependent oxidoreductase [Deltaproteobacteria bacterium]|nr:SDR family NAD(P)-dependent oxidoreductase [Deltaproteobacteria bacterium]
MSKEVSFDGRVAIVTGAGQGLGRSHALLLASRGAKVVVNDLGGSTAGEGKSSETADLVVEEIKQAGAEAVANYDSVEDGDAIVRTAMDTWGRVDIVINNAGILRDKSFKNMTDADWDIIFLFTTSSAGIYGNFGQTNYGSAKLSLVGFANTLSLEGQRKNVLVNTIAPFAASRLTEGLLPPAVFDSLKPEYVSPIVAYLCSEENDTTGGVYEVGGGFYSGLRWERTKGKTFRLGRNVSPDDIRSNWKQINDFTEADHISSVMESLGPIIENVEAGPTKGGNEFIDADEALGSKYPDYVSSYDEGDLALYALGVGAAKDPNDEEALRLVYESHGGGMKALPTFAVIPGTNAILGFAKEGISPPGLNYGLDRLLHGEQYIELVRPLPLRATLTTRAVVKDIWDKGKGALVVTALDSYDEDGDLLIKSEMTAFIRGAGGWGGERGPSADVNVPPSRAPDVVVEDAIPQNQALLYRLSGDWNPLHADPAMAKAFGFERPILHGLCTFGYAGRRVLEHFAPAGNPDFFKSIKVRFADNVYPGDTLVTEMWKESDQRIVFRCKVKERDSVVISNAAIELFEELPKPKEKKPTVASDAVEGDAADAAVEVTSADIIAAIDHYLKENPAVAEKAQTVFQLKLSDPDSLWTIDLKTGSAGAGETAKPDATLQLAEESYVALQKGEADPMKLFSTGKLKIAGDMMSVNKIEALSEMPFDLVLEKAAARAGGAAPAAPVAAPQSREPLAPKLFEALGKRLEEQPGLANEVGAVLQFYVRDPDSKWVVDLKHQPPALKMGETDGATTTITLDDAELAELSSGETTTQSLFQRGRLRIDGDMQPAHRLNFLKGLI